MRLSLDVALAAPAVFPALVEELAAALARQGIRFETGPGGRVMQDAGEVGRVTAWQTGERIALEWRAAPWDPDRVTAIELRFEPIDGGTHVTLEHHAWDGLLPQNEQPAWFASQLAAPFFAAVTPSALGDWITDRLARRPSGAQSREVYRDPIYHYPNFAVILEELALKPTDYLLEVACGGGAMLKEALQRGCRAAAVDHSPDMVQVAREANRDAIAHGRLEVLEAGADRLPFPDATFTCAAMTGVLGFLTDPVGVLREIRRVLHPGGRLVALGSDPKWRGTPAAPEPMASRLHFYEDDELAQLARDAGFEAVTVVRRDLEPYARGSRVPEEHVPMFAGGEPFLLAQRA
jgi:SAM-dependent methyltransferase